MMALQVRLALSGRLDQYDRALAQTHTGAVRSAVTRIRTQGRRQIERAGLGRLKNTWRGVVLGDRGETITRRGTAIDPTGRVYSSASVKGRVEDLLDVFERGTVVVPKDGQFLAIPTAAAGGRRAKPPSAYGAETFRVVPVGARGKKRGRPRANAVAYVLVHRGTGQVWFLLIPQVKLRKRLRIRPLVERIAATVPADIDRRWARALRRLEAVG